MATATATAIKPTTFSPEDACVTTFLDPGLSKSQQIIVLCLREAGRFPDDTDMSRIDAETDLRELLVNGGLDSNSMLIFKARLEEKLGLPAAIPITALINGRTVRALETEIMRASLAGTKKLLFPFATGGTKTPLFLFPPGGGELHCWIELTKHLPDRPIYGLRLRGLQPGERAFDSMKETVAAFVGEMRQVVPHGPYALMGMCFGGNIAFEVAKALERDGEKVVFVGGVDNAPHVVGQMSFASLRFFIIDLLATRGLLTPEERDAMKAELDGHLTADYPRIVTRRFRTRLDAAGITRERLEAWHRVFLGTGHMSEKYVPEGNVATYTSFWAAPLAEWEITLEQWEERVKAWSGLARTASFHFVPGNHYTALTREHVDVFQTILNERLKADNV